MAAGSGLDEVRRLAREASGLHASLKEESERRVVRWEWGTFVLHALEPAYFEIHKVRPGTKLAGEPKAPTSGVHGYGFDDEGRLVVVRQLTSFPGKYYETFHRWESGGTSRFHYGYDPQKSWINVAWLAHDEVGRVRTIDTVYARGNFISEIYAYDPEGRVIGLERRGTNPPFGDIHDFRDIEYDASGRIVRVYWRSPDGRRTLDFERPSADRTFAALRSALSDGLANAIVEALARRALQEPVFALAIHFCGAEYQHRLPPNVAVGLASDRARLLEEYGDASSVWNPAEWETQLDLELDPRLSAGCASASQDIWQNDLQEEANLFIVHLAQELGARALPLTRTDDFEVRAVDLERT